MKQIVYLPIYFLLLSCKNEDVLADKSMYASVTPRVVGGKDADLELHSYTLMLRNRGKFFCTAFAVHRLHVFSSGHCFNPSNTLFPPYEHVTVHSRVPTIQDLGIIHRIDAVTIHPEFDRHWKKSAIHDIAHIRLNEDTQLEFDEYQLKLELPTQDIDSLGVGVMTGWGCTVKGMRAPAPRLQVLSMRMMNNVDCQDYVEKKLYKEQLCAFHSEGHGCADGDSGGPLVVGNTVVGIHSWCHKGYCAEGLAEIFTNVYQELSFFQSSMPEEYAVQAQDSGSSTPTSSPEPDPDYKGKKPRGESSSKTKKPSWIRRLTCTAK